MIKHLAASVILALGIVSAAVSAAEPANPAVAASPFGWMGGYPDQAGNAAPLNLAQPQAYQVFTNPMNYPQMMNPAIMGQFMTPRFYLQFADPNNMAAWMNPAAYANYLNPNTYMTMMNPAAYMPMMNPGVYMQMMNPANYQALMNPANAMAWVNPASYGALTGLAAPAMGAFNHINPNAGGIPASPPPAAEIEVPAPAQ